MISIWEKESFLKYDYVIIGAGLTGLSTAISLREIDSKADILVLESGILPCGASTRNAGFACFGSASEILDDYATSGRDTALSLVEDRVKGLEILKRRIGRRDIGLQYDGGYELLLKDDDLDEDKLDELNKDLKTIFGINSFFDASEKLKYLKFGNVKRLIYTPLEGQLDSGKLLRALWEISGSLGVKILTGAKVLGFEDTEKRVKVITENYRFLSRKLILCTNAFTAKLLPDMKIKPARGLVVATAPVKNLPFKGSFHFDKGFYYFRNFQNRVIFGGGRNLALKTEETTVFEINEKIFADLQSKLEEIILPSLSFTIGMVWTGIMAFGNTKLPVIEKVSQNIAVAAGMGGMGVALGSLAGQKVARLVIRN